MSPTTQTVAGSHRIRVGSLSPDAFAPFGRVIQNPATHNGLPKLEKTNANQGTATKWLDVTDLRNWYDRSASRKAARVVMNMFVCSPRELREEKFFDVNILERHPFTSQTFIPAGVGREDNRRYLVIVAPTLPSTSGRRNKEMQPPYPTPPAQPKRSLKDRLLGARPNPFTNDFMATTTPSSSTQSPSDMPKGPGRPDLDNVQAFIARGDQAVTYGPGTWHAPMVALGDSPIDFVVVQYANGVGIEDCQEVEIETSTGGEVIAVDLSQEENDGTALKARL